MSDGCDIEVCFFFKQKTAYEMRISDWSSDVCSSDLLRRNEKAVAFIRHFLETNKPLAVICHGPQTMIETGMLKGRTMTSYPSIKTDQIGRASCRERVCQYV